jgi:hypothetical protein
VVSLSEAISLPNEPDDVNLTEALKMDFYRAQALKDRKNSVIP